MKAHRTTHMQFRGSRAAPLRAVWTTLLAVVLYAMGGTAQGGPQVSHSTVDRQTQRTSQVATQPVSTPAPARMSALPAVARAHISAAIGADDPTYHFVARSGGFHIDNPDHAVSAAFSSNGAEFRLGASRWTLRLRGYGPGNVLADLKEVAPEGQANRVEYRRDGLTEWYVNGPLGIEQGFTLERAPHQPNGQPLTLSFTLGGDLTAAVDEQRRGLTLTKGGSAVLRYAGLTAWDADGRELPAWLETAGRQLHLRVDDAGARYPLTIDPVIQAAKLVAQTTLYGNPHNDGVAGDQLGRAIAISDDGSTVVVGAPFKRLNNIRAGAAYVFVRPAELQGGWNSVSPIPYANRLQASDFATSGLLFGLSVAVSADGGTVVVGATGPNQSTYQGAAYVYVRAIGYWGGGWALAQNAKLTPMNPTGYSNFGGFGTSLSIDDSGATIVVGSPQRSTLDRSYPDGAAYAFFRPASGWVDATSSSIISGYGATGLINTQFGSSVSLSGNRNFLVVGSPAEWTYRGAAYVFVIDGWSNGFLFYRKVAGFYKHDGGEYEGFGTAVAMNGNGSAFAVSAPGAPVNGRRQGVVQVYEQPSGLYEWVLRARLTMASGTEEDALGTSLSISGDGKTIVAGSPHYAGTSAGAAYVFVKPVGGWMNNATENAKAQSQDLMLGDNFGHAVAVSADGATWVGSAPFATVGANARQGAAYVFTGVADNPVAAVNPSSLMFGPSEEGLNPGPQMVTLTNAGAGPLNVSAVSVTGPFSTTQNCLAASPLAPGSSCSEEVAFLPVSTELATGTLTFTDDSAGVIGSTQTVSLQGYGIKVSTSTAITATSANPALVNQPVAVSFVVTPQAGAQTMPSGIVTVQASTGESCSSNAPSGSCTLAFSTAVDRTLTATYSGDSTFKPSTSASASMRVVDFGLSVSPPAQSPAGRKASFTLTVTGVNGFAGNISLDCSGGPANTTCAVSPASVTLPGTTTAKATVTLPPNAAKGTYVITFRGSFAGVTRSTTATLTTTAGLTAR